MFYQLSLVSMTSYLLGSVPSAYLAVKAWLHQDIRQLGDGNVGMENTYKVTRSKLAAALVLIGDMGKGILANLLAKYSIERFSTPTTLTLSLAGFSVVMGHNFPVWLRFRGGKGQATAAGFMTALQPLVPIIGILAWAGVFVLTRYYALANILGVSMLLIVLGVFWPPTLIPSLLACLPMGYKYRHRFRSLLSGKERQETTIPFRYDE